MKAINIINRRMLSPENLTSDGTLAACAILGGSELLWGTTKDFNVHMDGVAQIVMLRGGYEKLQKTNPSLMSLIAW